MYGSELGRKSMPSLKKLYNGGEQPMYCPCDIAAYDFTTEDYSILHHG